MKVSVDVHFGYGAVAAFAAAVGLLIGLYVNEAVSFLFFLCMTIAFIAFHFLTLWVNWSRQEEVMQSARREHAEDQYRQAILEHEPVELLPMVEMELSSLRRTG